MNDGVHSLNYTINDFRPFGTLPRQTIGVLGIREMICVFIYFIYLFPGKQYIQRICNKNMTTQRTSLRITKKRK